MILFVSIHGTGKKTPLQKERSRSFPMASFHVPIVVGHPWRWAFGAWLQQTICMRQITAATAPNPIQNSGSTSIRFNMARSSFRSSLVV
jgi:hypothetical protein